MKIKKYFYKGFTLLTFVLISKIASAQNVGISSSNSFTPDASAALDVSFTNKGLLVPRVALTASNAAGPITSPATSLLVYNTATAGTSPNNVIPGYYYWSGSAWIMLSTSTQTASAWSTTGNTGTSYPTNYFGTKDNFGVHFKTNAIHRLWIDSLGSVGVGTNPIFSSSREKFLVDAGSVNYPTPAGAYNVISGKGYLDGYIQLNIQNTSPTAAASSDIVASNDQGSETSNYVDLGINSSANTSGGVTGGANTAYLYGTGSDFAIGNAAAGRSLLLFTGGTGANERMRIDGAGNVGIGTNNPGQKLDVAGSINAANSIYIDAALSNTGTLNPGLYFGGASSGEGISSKRTSGTNQYGIDFYTASNNRMTINNGGNVGIGTNTPTEKLDITGNLKFSGALMPNNSAGTAGYFLQSAGAGTPPVWVSPASSSAWSTTGNTGTNYKTNFLGNIDNAPLRFRTNNTERAILDSLGNFGIGSEDFDPTNPEKLMIDAGTTNSTNLIGASGTINSFLQFNIQNLSNGAAASTDIVATANNGTDNSAYIDMGINSAGYTTTTGIAGITTKPNTAYLYSNAADFVIGNGAQNKNVIFFTNSNTAGTTTPNGTERMRIDGATGNIGINVSGPTSTLAVNGSIAVVATTRGNNTYTLTASDYIVINTSTSNTPTYTLPTASTCQGRMYRIVNHGSNTITVSPAVINASGTTINTVSTNAGSNVLEVVSDGSNWRRINQ
ncbi:MAG: hypothetical protein EOP42_01765 [Sphingobacteriaceae bacterium]|nr:MAG: hypothetical protein EOP42_01765 [Sphingobacteriaceae bacterium]